MITHTILEKMWDLSPEQKARYVNNDAIFNQVNHLFGSIKNFAREADVSVHSSERINNFVKDVIQAGLMKRPDLDA